MGHVLKKERLSENGTFPFSDRRSFSMVRDSSRNSFSAQSLRRRFTAKINLQNTKGHPRPGRGGAWRITLPKQARVRPLPEVNTTSASARARFREKRYTVPAGSL